jgi:CRP-like cAMP-binding protein
MKEGMPTKENGHTAFDIIRSHGVLHTFPPNIEIFRQEQIIGGVYLLEEGKVKMARTEYCGNEVVIEIAEAVQILGIASVISQLPATVTATTLTTCSAISLNTRLFLTLVEQEPDLTKSLLRLVSEYSCEQVIRHAWLGAASSRQRLAFEWQDQNTYSYQEDRYSRSFGSPARAIKPTPGRAGEERGN